MKRCWLFCMPDILGVELLACSFSQESGSPVDKATPQQVITMPFLISHLQCEGVKRLVEDALWTQGVRKKSLQNKSIMNSKLRFINILTQIGVNIKVA